MMAAILSIKIYVFEIIVLFEWNYIGVKSYILDYENLNFYLARMKT